jgi:hypothetical protein
MNAEFFALAFTSALNPKLLTLDLLLIENPPVRRELGLPFHPVWMMPAPTGNGWIRGALGNEPGQGMGRDWYGGHWHDIAGG